MNTQKCWNNAKKFPNIPQNIAGIFVRKLAILEQSPCTTSCLCFGLYAFSSVAVRDMKNYLKGSSTEEWLGNTVLGKYCYRTLNYATTASSFAHDSLSLNNSALHSLSYQQRCKITTHIHLHLHMSPWISLSRRLFDASGNLNVIWLTTCFI